MRRSFIEEAILCAEKSMLKIANHGAIVIYRGKIVGRGYNKYCVDNKKINRWSVHAEVDAINNALRKISLEDLRKSTLIVVRKIKDIDENSKDNINNPRTKLLTSSTMCTTNTTTTDIAFSAPCKHCTNFIKRCGIRRCYHS